MPTYHEIMTTDLATLTTAADRWDGMAKEFGKRETEYKRDVHGITPGPPSPATWTGLSADAAGKRFDVTLHEFQNAQTEAKAIASLLRDAHAQFTTLRVHLKSEREAAVKAGIKVSERGLVAYDEERAAVSESGSAMHDPGSRAEVHRAVESWQARIDKAVRAVGDADTGVEIALSAAVFDSDLTDGTGNGFNARAKGDIEQYEVAVAKESARELADGERLTPSQLAELKRSFRDNCHDPAFSRTLLDSLGPSGTIRLTNNLGDLAHMTDPGARRTTHPSKRASPTPSQRPPRTPTPSGTRTGGRKCGRRASPAATPISRQPGWTRSTDTSRWSRSCSTVTDTGATTWRTSATT